MRSTKPDEPTVRKQAQEALDHYTLADMKRFLTSLEAQDLRAEVQAGLLQRAEAAQFRDHGLGGTILPAHLYVATEMLRDRGLPSGVLTRFLGRLRDVVYARSAGLSR